MTATLAKGKTPVSKTAASKRGSEEDRSTPSLVPLNLGRVSPIANFVDIVEPDRTWDDLVLSSENLTTLSFITLEHKKRDTLRRHGSRVRNRLLFCGPPGCGKTLTAEIFANEVGLDLYIIRLDGIISSYLGETAGNIRTIIEAAERCPCVLFFDEFDALAQARSENGGHGELRRVVNSLLMMFERYSGRGFIISATNRESTLDDALWRRYDDILLFDRPTLNQARIMLKLRTKNFKTDFEISKKAEKLKGFSFAEIERVCAQAIKSAILGRKKAMREEDFESALVDEMRRRKIQQRLAPSKS